jgi:hypothetical protein
LESINVYELVKPEIISKHGKEIGEILFGITPTKTSTLSGNSANGSSKHIHISPASGCISYSNNQKLWRNRSSDSLPHTVDAATRIAKSFLTQANTALAKSRKIDKREFPQLFPQTLRPLETRAVFLPGSNTADHWLCQFIVELPAGMIKDKPSVPPKKDDDHLSIRSIGENIFWVSNPIVEYGLPVNGSTIDVRVGSNAEIVGLNSRWRPFKRIIRAEKLVPPKPHSDDSEVLLYYAIEGPEEPQRFISPYYLTLEDRNNGTRDIHGIHFDISPASPYSLVVRVEQELIDNGTKIRLRALAIDSGVEKTHPPVSSSSAVNQTQKKVTFSWWSWSLDHEPLSRLSNHGKGETLEIGPGAYNVILVAESEMGAISSEQILVYTRGMTKHNDHHNG